MIITSIDIWLNGLLLKQPDDVFVTPDGTFIFDSAPKTNDVVTFVKYFADGVVQKVQTIVHDPNEAIGVKTEPITVPYEDPKKALAVADYIEKSKAAEMASGKVIKTLGISHDESEDCFKIVFKDGSEIELWDAGQSCCESRYITCDDELAEFHGAKFWDIEELHADVSDNGYDEEHEITFIAIKTSVGDITLCTHNEHNGYYGGFVLKTSFIPAV